MPSSSDDFQIQIEDVSQWDPPEGQRGQGMMLHTTRGDIETILHSDTDEPPTGAILWVWGARGGFDGPAGGIFGNLAEELKGRLTSLRVNYRNPAVLPESVMDTLAAISFLKATGHTEIVLVGHSFGGAVVITASILSPLVKAVVALSSQTAGASGAGRVSPRPLLLVHGGDDSRLAAQCSEQIFEWAKEPKEIVIYPGTEHGLNECKDELHDLLRRWIPERFETQK